MSVTNAQLLTLYESFNKLLVELYNKDVPLHSRVRNFLYLFADIIYYDRCSILFYHKLSDGRYKKHSAISLNWDEVSDYIKKYTEYYCYLDDVYPVLDRQTPFVFRSTDFFNMEKRAQTEYWRDYLYPTNNIYSIDGNIQLESSKGLLGMFCFYRNANKSDFSDEELHIAKMLQPHLSNVFKHYMDNDSSNNLPIMMDNYNCTGICLIDENFQIVRSNSKFREIEMKHPGMLSSKITSMCCDLSKSDGKSGKLYKEYKFDESPVFLEVNKLTTPLNNMNRSSNICYNCLAYDLSYFFQQTLMTAKEKYYLTPREFDIIKKVLQGKKNEEIAAELYLSIPSVKKYLASIYSKMEIKTQKQILEKLKLI